VSTYGRARILIRHIFVKLFLVTLLKIVSIFEFLQKSENYDALVDTYMYLLCYLAAIGFKIRTDCVLYEVGAEHLNLTLRRLMSYIYGAPILDVSRSHTTTQHGR